jgi:hypothetical protein
MRGFVGGRGGRGVCGGPTRRGTFELFVLLLKLGRGDDEVVLESESSD